MNWDEFLMAHTNFLIALVFTGFDKDKVPIIDLVLALARGSVQKGDPTKATNAKTPRHLKVPRYLGASNISNA